MKFCLMAIALSLPACGGVDMSKASDVLEALKADYVAACKPVPKGAEKACSVAKKGTNLFIDFYESINEQLPE